jgi:hypothetical protein
MTTMNKTKKKRYWLNLLNISFILYTGYAVRSRCGMAGQRCAWGQCGKLQLQHEDTYPQLVAIHDRPNWLRLNKK